MAETGNAPWRYISLMLHVIELDRVPVPDERFDWLCEHHKPASKVSNFSNSFNWGIGTYISKSLFLQFFVTWAKVSLHVEVPAFLNVTDIAGLVKGASEGQGLGNAFLSHIKVISMFRIRYRTYGT